MMAESGRVAALKMRHSTIRSITSSSSVLSPDTRWFIRMPGGLPCLSGA